MPNAEVIIINSLISFRIYKIMRKIVSFLFSMFFTVLLLTMFAISIAYATFIENDYGTATAQALIYQAWWFELLLFVGVVNLAGSVVKYKLVNRKKMGHSFVSPGLYRHYNWCRSYPVFWF